jgi:alpha-1,6-mannosyltransferase
MLGLAAVALAQVAWSGSLRVDESPLGRWAWIGLGAAFGVFAVPAATLYLRVHDGAAGFSPKLLLRGAVLVQLAAAVAPPLTSNDLWSNLAYGRMLLDGLDPYAHGPSVLGPEASAFVEHVGRRWIDTPMVYGPLSAWQDQLAVWLGHDVLAAALVFKTTMVLAALAAVYVAWRVCAGARGDGAAKRNFVFLAWNPLLAWEVSGQAHNDGIMVLALVGFLVAAKAERVAGAALLLALAVAAKFAVLPIVGLYLIMLARRSFGQAALAAGVIAATVTLSFLPFWQGSATLAAPLHAMSGQDLERNARSFFAIFYDVHRQTGGAPPWRSLAGAYAALALVPLGIVALRGAALVRTVVDVIHHGAIFLLVYLLVSAVWTQPWYATWLLPLALSPRDERVQRAVAVFCALLLVQYAVQLDPYTYVLVHGIPLVMLWPLLRAAAAARLSRREGPRPAP